MPIDLFTSTRTVEPAEIDRLGHVNNLVYLRWALDAAVAHSDANGWGFEQYQQAGAAWVVRSHHITYYRPALPGETIEIRSGIAELSRATCKRIYVIERLEADGRTRLAQASTDWVFVDIIKGTPKRIPAEVAAAFPLIEPARLGIDRLS